MNPRHDEFLQLRRLLVLKRYEQPPPGYFNQFSSEVIGRIRAGERVRDYSFFDLLSWEAPWLQRLWAILETRPLFAGAFGLAVCSLLLTGAVYSETAAPMSHAQPKTQVAETVPPGSDLIAGVTPAVTSNLTPVLPTAPLPASLFQRVRQQNPDVLLINDTFPR